MYLGRRRKALGGCGGRCLRKLELSVQVFFELIGSRFVAHEAHCRNAAEASDELATVDFHHD
jgi:hypothetical protein